MNAGERRRDLVVLVADKSISQAIAGLLGRTQALGVREIDCKVSVHQQRDAGCRVDAADFLRPFTTQFEHALVVFDREGCGSEASREAIEEGVETDLRRNGWGGRARAVVIDPELEAWVWTESMHVAQELGWPSFQLLRDGLGERGFWPAGAAKPPDPKGAMGEAMRLRQRPKSASTFGSLGKVVSFRRCQDAAFQKLRGALREWFPVVNDPGQEETADPLQPD